MQASLHSDDKKDDEGHCEKSRRLQKVYKIVPNILNNLHQVPC